MKKVMKKGMIAGTVLMLILVSTPLALAGDKPNGQPFDAIWEKLNELEGLIGGGTLKVDKIEYNTPREHNWSVSSEGFHPGRNVDYTNTYGMGGAYMHSGTGAMVCDVHLPDGAKITAFEVFFYNGSSTQDLRVRLMLQFRTGAYSDMANVDSIGISGYGSDVDTTINYGTVDNGKYSYLIYAWGDPWDGSNLRVMSAQITYELSEAQ